MKTSLVSFDNLKHRRFIEHKISDHDSMNSKKREGMQGSLQSQVPAQDYERDILPRYKEALHIGHSSSKEHFRNKGRSTTSVFRAMSTYGPLPHIIGSEEYSHDNSCGLADDVLPLTDEFSWLREFEEESSDSAIQELLICLNLNILECRKVLRRRKQTIWYLLHENLKQCWKLPLLTPTSFMMWVLRNKMFL